jgi:phosphotransferase family enzyme
MPQTVQIPVAAAATSCNYITIAQRKLQEIVSSQPYALAAPTVSELEKALREKISSCDLWRKNWRNRIYLVQLASGEFAVAKQVVRGDDAIVQYQYDQLHALAALGIPGLYLPRALALIVPKRTIVMEFVRGQTLRELARHGSSADELVAVSELSGQILAQIHLAWTQEIAPMPVEVLARDLAAAPWRLSSREKSILKASLEILAQAKVSMGQVCYDYQSKNLLYNKSELTLIDPPDALWQGIHLWDYSRFRSGLRRMLWRIYLRQPLQRHRQARLRETFTAFKRGYIECFNKQHPEPAYFAIATRLLELQHTGMSMAMNQGKLNLARRLKSTRPLLIATKTSLTTFPLLELEKRWLIRQLARELP